MNSEPAPSQPLFNDVFDQDLISKYDRTGPRYTSYPTALELKEGFDNEDFISAVKASPNQLLSIYIHLPFCHSLCYYCGCNKIVTRNQDKLHKYLDFLKQEIMQRASLFKSFEVSQIHFGGGTPSFLSIEQLNDLLSYIERYFTLASNPEVSIEIDPRNIELSYADELAKIGFNRISIGVQDTNYEVQETINRVQSTQFIRDLVDRAKRSGINSINLDLVYGLPKQTPDTFQNTLNDAVNINPDRISLFSYAHMPSKFPAQRKLPEQFIPTGSSKLELMKQALSYFCANGYEMIGMDHFAKPDDVLAKAKKNKTLGRNFQGYTVEETTDLLGLGLTSISTIGNTISQNTKSLNTYYQQFNQKLHCIEKGLVLSSDDAIRRHVIKELMCNLYLNKTEVEDTFEIDFDDYFASELGALKEFVEDGLIELNNQDIKVYECARLFIRNICMCFDAYIKLKERQQRFSRII
ncbi:MAG: oxygen-independent coproporphyrinogen III oxidase [Alteromonadaceae bacterium]|nr:oxygen-independent coproporphyrinogen III oxidase [Alteromonadaceae bacterium]